MPFKMTTLLLLAVCSGCIGGASTSVVLPAEQVQVLLKQCSRSDPENVTSLWVVPARVARDIDRNIDDVSALRSPSGKTIVEPHKYFRQYGGVVAGGRKLVYINAFSLPGFIDPEELSWRTKAIVVCDGGSTAWGAMYDPATQHFSKLTINSQLGGA